MSTTDLSPAAPVLLIAAKRRDKKSRRIKKSEGEKGKGYQVSFSTFCLSGSSGERGGMRGGASRVKPPPRRSIFLGKESSSLITRREGKNSSLSSCLPSLDFGTRKEGKSHPLGFALLQNKEREK